MALCFYNGLGLRISIAVQDLRSTGFRVHWFGGFSG